MTEIPIAISKYPWQPASTKTGNRAIGDLGVGLMNSLKTARGIHTETLMTVVGSLAGFAAQNAALSLITSGATSTVKPRSLAIVSSVKPGEIYLFGDAINAFIFPESGSVLPLGALIAGAALKAGVKEIDLPNDGEIAAYVASVVGSGDFGRLRVRAGLEPQLQPLAALNNFWTTARDILSRPPVKWLFRQESILQEIHWPIVLGLVASQYIAMTRQVLSPAISAALVMESAVMSSKINPELVDPGRWRIDTGNSQQPITRLH